MNIHEVKKYFYSCNEAFLSIDNSNKEPKILLLSFPEDKLTDLDELKNAFEYLLNDDNNIDISASETLNKFDIKITSKGLSYFIDVFAVSIDSFTIEQLFKINKSKEPIKLGLHFYTHPTDELDKNLYTSSIINKMFSIYYTVENEETGGFRIAGE